MIFPSSIATMNDIGLNTDPGSIMLVTARGSISAYDPSLRRESDEMAFTSPVATSIKIHMPARALRLRSWSPSTFSVRSCMPTSRVVTTSQPSSASVSTILILRFDTFSR